MQGTNSRAARIAALIQRVIASNMESTLHDKRLKNVTITDVKVNASAPRRRSTRPRDACAPWWAPRPVCA